MTAEPASNGNQDNQEQHHTSPSQSEAGRTGETSRETSNTTAKDSTEGSDNSPAVKSSGKPPHPSRILGFTKPVPALVAFLAGIVTIAGGIVAAVQYAPDSSPFDTTPEYSESFNYPFDDPAKVDTAAGVFRLSNPVDENAGRYIWVSLAGDDTEDVDLTNRPVSADVRISRHSTSSSSAGIIYRWNSQSKRYYAFLVSTDGTYSFVMRGASGGLSYKLTETSDKIRTEGWNKVGIVGKGDRIDLYINESRVRTVDAPELIHGSTGVIATSTGVYEFDNFQISNKCAACLAKSKYRQHYIFR